MRFIRQRWRALGVLIAAVLAAGLGGCGRAGPGAGGGSAAAKSGPESGATATATATAGAPVSEAECRAFAAAVEEAVSSGNSVAFGDRIDWDAIFLTATAGIDAPASSRDGFIQGVKSSMGQEQGLIPQIVATVKGGGSYRFLRERARDKHRTALFRLVTPDSYGFNYHEFVLARRPDGQVRAVDIYIFLSGELISTTMRRMYIPVAAQVSRGLIDKLLDNDQLFMKNFPKFQKMTTEVRSRRPAEALKIYRELPPELRKDKNVLLLRLQAAQEVSNEEYFRAIADFRAAHPDDPCIDMISIDEYLLKKDYTQAFACVDRIDRAIGGDPYLDVTRANIHLDRKQADAAKQAARRALAEDPNLQDAYWTLVTVALQEHQFAETAALLDQLERRFQVPFDNLAQLPDFAEFVRSPEYREWIERPKPDREKPAETGRDRPQMNTDELGLIK